MKNRLTTIPVLQDIDKIQIKEDQIDKNSRCVLRAILQKFDDLQR